MTRWFLLATMIFVLAASGWADPVLLNGSFEVDSLGSPFFGDATTVADWTHTGGGDGPHWAIGYVDGGGSVTVAGDGKEFVTMGGGGGVGTASWFQDVSGFAGGKAYDLGFMLASETTADTAQVVTAEIIDSTGLVVAIADFTAPTATANYWNNWGKFDLPFVATTGSERVEFTSTTIHDVGLDNVTIAARSTAVPEPATIGLLGLAFAGTAILRRRLR